MTPKRIQRRGKGWRKPPNTVCVSRPSKWGNGYRTVQDTDDDSDTWIVVSSDDDVIVSHPFTSKVAAIKDAISWFRDSLEILLRAEPHVLEPLRDKDMACWCALDMPCHADVLLELANKPEEPK